MSEFKIHRYDSLGDAVLLKDGKAINEFGMLKEVAKRDIEIERLENYIETHVILPFDLVDRLIDHLRVTNRSMSVEDAAISNEAGFLKLALLNIREGE